MHKRAILIFKILLVTSSSYAQAKETRPPRMSSLNAVKEEARNHIKEGRPKRALELLEKISRKDHINESDYFFLIGRSQQDLQENIAAIQSYTIAIFLDAKNSKALVNRALTKGALKDLEGAIKDLNEAIRINPNNAEAYLNRGVTYAGLNRPEQAVPDFGKAIALKPNFTDAYRNRAIMYFHLSKKNLACQDLRSASQHGDTEAKKWQQQNCK
jgi:tetratricopeptide (TPR) repeat protein